MAELSDQIEAWIMEWDYQMREYGPNPEPLADFLAAKLEPETVTTVEELDALPVGSIVRKPPEDSERIEYEDGSWEQGAVAEKRLDREGQPAWFLVGTELGWRSHQVDLIGGVVLFRPTREEKP